LIICTAIGLIAGALLARRFPVLLLIPAIVIASVAIVLYGVASGLAASQSLLLAAATAFALQMGFLVGVFVWRRHRAEVGSGTLRASRFSTLASGGPRHK